MTIYCIGGVSGSGKTALRVGDSYLCKLTCIDIANIYDVYPGISRKAARRELLARLEQRLDSDPDESIVLEAFFAPNKLQRKGVEDLADIYNVRVRYIWCAAPRDTCYQRILSDWHADGLPRHQARLTFVDDAPEKYFYDREGEELPCWLEGSCNRCGDWPAEAPPCSKCGDAVAGSECIYCAEDQGHAHTCHRCHRRHKHRHRRGHRFHLHY